jgi:hypothetical protein
MPDPKALEGLTVRLQIPPGWTVVYDEEDETDETA